MHRDGFFCVLELRIVVQAVAARRQVQNFVMVFPSGLFWDFGSLFRTLRRHFVTRRCGSRIFVHVVAATSASCRGTSGTSLLMFPLFPTLRRRVSHAGARLRYQRFLHAGERLRYQRLSDHQSTQDEVRSRIFRGSRAERFSRSHASSMIPVGSERRDSCGRGSRRL